MKGVYHINAVDEVTQWQVVGSVAAISQSHLKPVLQAILGLLKELLIEQTKSRARKCNDNGLVESKNGG